MSKNFPCPYDNCGKFYGSEGSLNLHMKIKHKAGSKTEREKLAKSIVWANCRGAEDLSPAEIVLPPGCLENAAKTLGVEIANKKEYPFMVVPHGG